MQSKGDATTCFGWVQKAFTGVSYGAERAKQEEVFIATRAKRWLLMGASCDYVDIRKNIITEGLPSSA